MISATVDLVGWETGVSADDALSDLYRTHGAWLLGLIQALVGDRATAEDVVQEAFLRVHTAWPRLREPERAAGYLRTTALNIARSGFRRRLVALRHPTVPSRDVEGADHEVVLHDEQRAVIDALQLLPTRQRECLVLRFYGDLAEREVADTLHISQNSVKTHVRRGLAALENRLGPAR